jgi:flagellar assembly protein FliH
VSKVIRTARVGGRAVILGKDESNLYLANQPEGNDDVAVADFASLFEARLQQVRDELTQEWEGRLRDEHETMKTAAQRQLSEAEEKHRTEVEQIHQQRYEEGHQDGVKSKEDEARDAVSRVDVLHESLVQLRRQVIIESEALVVDLSASMAHKVTGVQAELEPTIVARVIRSALEHLSARSDLVIKVHEEDLQVARKFSAKWVEKVSTGAIFKVEVSDHVERGGCMIEGVEESVDARLEEQFDILRQALRAEVLAENLEPPPGERPSDDDASRIGELSAIPDTADDMAAAAEETDVNVNTDTDVDDRTENES